MYKIFAKVLANRLKPLLNGLISENQSAFIPGRLITDNIMIAFEAQHFLKNKRQGIEGYAALKLDMSKAYDRIEWNMLRAMLIKYGFCDKWVKLMMECVASVEYAIQREGEELGPIIPQRGLRQGDPLSPYLFILVGEGLSALIRKQELQGNLHGVKIARQAPRISHLLFADDSYIFFKANQSQSSTCKLILDLYTAATGQTVNFDKSSLTFSKNVGDGIRQSVGSILGVRMEGNAGKYLGLPSLVGRNKRDILGFIKDKIVARINA